MKYCTQCGTAITSDSPEGLCARCLLRVAMRAEASEGDDTQATQSATSSAHVQSPAVIDIADAAEVARRLPQFEILGLLGRGGMGVVYKARQIQLDRVVALKILPPADARSPGFVERFRREARSLAKLSHPNIVSVYDFGETNGLYYFVMEWVDGLNLRETIHAQRLTAAEALAVVPKICDALQFAHEEGVVHRDIKPENILLDKRGRVKIADFGLAKLLGRAEGDARLTMSGATLGTPRYMAPEQVEKPETVDHRADIYSLGVVFYEMLTGDLPMGRFAPPSHKVQVDVRLDEIVLHALEQDVERRYQHASQVRDDVEEVTRVAPTPATQQQQQQQQQQQPRPPARAGRDVERWWVIAGSAILYATAFALPTAYISFHEAGTTAEGGRMTGVGAFSVSLMTGKLLWLANPALWAGWLLLAFRRPALASLAGLVATALAASAIFHPDYRLLNGYACWLTSVAVFAAGAVALAIRDHRHGRPRAVANPDAPQAVPPAANRRFPVGYFVLSSLIFAAAFAAALACWNSGNAVFPIGGAALFVALCAAASLGRRHFPAAAAKWRGGSRVQRAVRLCVALAACVAGYHFVLGGTLARLERSAWYFNPRNVDAFEQSSKGKEYELVRQLSAYKKSIPTIELQRIGWESGDATAYLGPFSNKVPYFDPDSFTVYFDLLFGFSFLVLAAVQFVISNSPVRSRNDFWAKWPPFWPSLILALAAPTGWCANEFAGMLLEMTSHHSSAVFAAPGYTVAKAAIEDVLPKVEHAIDAEGYLPGDRGSWTMTTVPQGEHLGQAGFVNACKPSPFDRWHWHGGVLVSACPHITVSFVSGNQPAETALSVEISQSRNSRADRQDWPGIIERILNAAKSAERGAPTSRP